MTRSFSRNTPRWQGKQDKAWAELRKQVLAESGGLCEIRLEGRCTGKATQVDHIRALSEGGARLERSNVRAACHACNSYLGARLGGQRLAMRQNRHSRAW